ncbi:transcription termination factor Rho [Ligilactobacillus acidipiscis DSM 15836]|jgi:transcription termination factor Rho|uniref:Transcription termination factor Rho n=2 Tax=Ligilactobacillus acidipiscis TaxID=89059 RepID=A0A0R2K4P3_9LACO|nr:transcription termination factor Rho [Ligilactobacillus acidipiscis]KRM26240.1 transcription termination factor Rho [Ligilactobacillus acidipiscis DSM 15836]KRN82156.1 transcription termination factor Rho [Ligilactobacillus acidipiscis]WEV57706.1 transcription termination factor Rho [Ligilactobacillus acidipiscis]SFV40172.1 Transcription termination factor Rho [Ligilactobacillus acidipiscis]GAW64936.1 transcription termination factor Rho [Ligilactobacillus acidipiscis]
MPENLTLADLEGKTLKEIYNFARQLKIPYYSQMNKKELSVAIIRAQAKEEGFYYMNGVLDVVSHEEGYGFLRPINYGHSQEDIYVSASQIRRFGLRSGDLVAGKVRAPKTNERYYGMMHVDSVNGKDPEGAKTRPHFPALTPLFPNKQMHLETSGAQLATRVIDAFAPIGFGQRGLIVAPPKTGKTNLLAQIARGISKNYPKTKLIMLLIDERPEEVTEMERTIDGEVVYSTFDQKPENHVRVAELVLQRAERLVEEKEDVVILLDSLTRLTRSYNLVEPPSGRTLSGGIDPAALFKPKRFFGAARNIEEGGSLTILATALVDTGSRMDDFIFEEFKGTGNQELQLDRGLAQRRIFPAVDIKRSSTRKEELLLPAEVLNNIWKLRKVLSGEPENDTPQVLSMLRKTKDNQEFYDQAAKWELTQRKKNNRR